MDAEAHLQDHFELEDEGQLCFPCCVCIHRHGTDQDMPCRVCLHNANASPEGPHQRV